MVSRCGSESWDKEDMFSKEIELRVEIMLTILGSMVKHGWGDLYDHLMSWRIFSLIKVRHTYMEFKFMCNARYS